MKARQNASLISTALQYGIEVFGHEVFSKCTTNMHSFGRNQFPMFDVRWAAESYHKDPESMDLVTELLTAWGLGLSGLRIDEEEHPYIEDKKSKIYSTYGLHKDKNGRAFELPFSYESSGTQSCFILLTKLLSVLKAGGLAVIDEIENDLRPNMVEPILDLFTDPNSNPHNAQIIFTCHSPEVLDFLQKSQVIFVEKTECESEAYRGDEITGLRSDDNLRAKYMSGALGAVPSL